MKACVRHRVIFPEEFQPIESVGLRVEAKDKVNEEMKSDILRPRRSR
jgi:hypothetical protein